MPGMSRHTDRDHQHAAELSSGEIDSALGHDLKQAEQQADSVRAAALRIKSSSEQT